MEFVSRGNQLHYRRWWVEKSLGVVVVAHGLGEHSGRYKRLALQLNQAGYSVYALDHYGHGLSVGKRGHIGDFAWYSDDLYQFIQVVRHDNPDSPLHLLGHSMGGVIASGCAIRYDDIDSLILSAPGFRGAKEPGSLENWLLHQAVKFTPSLTLPNRINPNWISRDAMVVSDYLADDLVHNRISLQWFASFLRERTFIEQHLEAITVPCLMLLPEGDKLVDVETSRNWFDRLGSESRRLCAFPQAYHEVFNEAVEGPQAYASLQSHLSALMRRSEFRRAVV